MTKKYEANISSYAFQMIDEGTIEVWSDMDSEYPYSYIYVKDGAVKSEKDFHYEIMEWAVKNNIV